VTVVLSIGHTKGLIPLFCPDLPEGGFIHENLQDQVVHGGGGDSVALTNP